MSRASGKTRRLMDHLTGDPKWGALLGMMATSYEFDADFFEMDFLPAVLGLGSWDDAGWTSRVALEKNLAGLEGAWVAVDQRRYRGRPRSWRVEVRPALGNGGATLHAKVSVVVYEAAVRVQVASANLTEPGYRENREVVFSLVATPNAPESVGLVRQLVEGMPSRLGPWWSPTAGKVHALAVARLTEWPNSPSDARVAWSDSTTPLWGQVLDTWEAGAPLDRVIIVSPFWSAEGDAGPLRQFIGGLRERARVPATLPVLLLTEAEAAEDEEWRPKLPAIGAFDPKDLGVELTAQAVLPRPSDEGNEGVLKQRALHAKVVLLEGPKRSVAYCGSANFTARGWGFGSAKANLEAGLIVTGTADALRTTVLPPTCGPIVKLHRGNLPPAVETDETDVAIPTFMRGVWLVKDPKDVERLMLRVEVDEETIQGSWSLSRTSGALLCEGKTGAPGVVEFPLPAEVFEELLRTHEVVVRWWSCDAGARYPINIELEARASLPAVIGSGQPDESALLAYYQGRIRFEDLFPPPHGWEEDAAAMLPSLIEVERSVDTSRIQSYQVRAFVEALQGIIDDLSAAAQTTEASMRRAVLGPVSPTALAREIERHVLDHTRSPTAAGFELVELGRCLLDVRNAEGAKPGWAAVIELGLKGIHGSLAKIAVLHADLQQPQGSFRRYSQTVLGWPGKEAVDDEAQ
jgi:hypothetical protein